MRPDLFPTDPDEDLRYLGADPDPCPYCASTADPVALGTLGRVFYVRCRSCGADRALS